MSDGFALVIVIIGAVALGVVTFLNRGNYEQQFFLDAGSYQVGFDIPPGKGDLKAATGGGNFIVRNKSAKSWSVGNSIGTSGTEPNRFRNLTLLKGDILEINGNVSVLVTPPLPVQDPSEEALGPGIYRFGLDVPPGKYDLEIVSGDGDVLLVEVGKDQYVFYQDMSKENPVKASSFKNIICTREFELWVNGNLQIKLNPSERQPWFLRRLY